MTEARKRVTAAVSQLIGPPGAQPALQRPPPEPPPQLVRVALEPGESIVSAATSALAGTRRPPTEEYGDLPVNAWAAWTLGTAQSAVRSHALGMFGQAALLTESMLADDRIQAAVNGRTKAVTRCEPRFDPVDAPGGEEAAQELEALYEKMVPEEVVENMMVWTIFMGFALAEVIWEPNARLDRWVPRLKVWHPLTIYYNIGTRRYVAITMEGPIEIEPGDPKWLLYCPFGEYRGWLRGAVRSVPIPWMVRQYALRDMARFSEKHGMPMVVAKMPYQSPAEDKARFMAALRTLGSDTTMALPVQGGPDAAAWDVMLLEARDRAWEAFPRLRDVCDQSITLAIRGTNLTTEVDGGSYAAANAHREEDADYAQADRKKIARALQQQLFRNFCLFNYGDAELAPGFALVPPETQLEPEELAKVWNEAATAVTALEAKGWKVDRGQVADRFGIPLRAGEDFEDDEDRPALTLTPSDTASIVTVNEARAAQGMEPLLTPDGKEDPDGNLTIAQFVAKRQADAEQAAAPRPEEEQQRKLEEAEKFGLPVPGEEGVPGEELEAGEEDEEEDEDEGLGVGPDDEIDISEARARVATRGGEFEEDCHPREGGKFTSGSPCGDDDKGGDKKEAAEKKSSESDEGGGDSGGEGEGGEGASDSESKDSGDKEREASDDDDEGDGDAKPSKLERAEERRADAAARHKEVQREHEELVASRDKAVEETRKGIGEMYAKREAGVEQARALEKEAGDYAKQFGDKARDADDEHLSAAYKDLAARAKEDEKALRKEAKREERIIAKRDKVEERFDKAIDDGDYERAGELLETMGDDRSDLVEVVPDVTARAASVYANGDEYAEAQAGVQRVIAKANTPEGAGADEYDAAVRRQDEAEKREKQTYDETYERVYGEFEANGTSRGPEASSVYDLDDDAIARSEKRVERARRAQALHEREVARRKRDEDADNDGKTGKEEESDDDEQKSAKEAEARAFRRVVALALGQMTIAEAFQKKRVAVAGGPHTGKTTLAKALADGRELLSTDDYIKGENGRAAVAFLDVPDQALLDLAGKEAFVIEGVQVARCLRMGLQVDVVLVLDEAFGERTKGQEAQAKGVRTVLDEWLATMASVPVLMPTREDVEKAT